jgi:hypothetical protein
MLSGPPLKQKKSLALPLKNMINEDIKIDDISDNSFNHPPVKVRLSNQGSALLNKNRFKSKNMDVSLI